MRYIDADAVIAKIKAEHCDKCKHDDRCFYCDIDKVLLELEEADDADVVEVVRCKDCIHFMRLSSGRYCNHCSGMDDPLPNDFCNYGEKGKKNDL